MEPFGLFNLLKSLLPQTENPPQASGENADGNGSGLNGTNGAAQTEKDLEFSSKQEKGAPNFANEPPQNAFLDFVTRHDERKKQIKKP